MYNCERPEDDMLYYAYYYTCHDAKEIEKRTKYFLRDYQKKNNLKKDKDETYFMNYLILKKYVELICTNYNLEINEINKIVSTFEDSFMDEIVIPEPMDLPNRSNSFTITEKKYNIEIKRDVIDVVSLTDTEKKEKLIQAISLFITDNNIKNDFNYYNEKDNTDVQATIIWKDIVQYLMTICELNKNAIKASLWKESMTNIVKESKCIKKINWHHHKK